jgi:hypothetical protein
MDTYHIPYLSIPKTGSMENDTMKRQKSTRLRVILGIAGIGVGLGVQVAGAIVDKILGIPLFVILGFVVMGYLVYRWAIK